MRNGIVVLAVGLGLTGPVWAEERPLTYDRINLTANAGDEVENDTLVAVLYAQQEGGDTKRLAAAVNEDVTWAVGLAKGRAGIKVQTLDYHTNPIYRKQTLSGWRVRQSLRLESRDSAALSELIGELQKRLAVSNITYRVSREQRRKAEDTLITAAIAAFSERAALVSGQLGRPGYRIVEMSVNTSGQPVRPQMRTMALEKMSSMSAPPLEAGTQSLQVTVSGTIELQRQP